VGRVKRKILALALAGALVLSGCSSLLDHAFLDVEPHADEPATEEDPSIPRVETYNELMSGIYFFVSQGLSRGTIHISNYEPRTGSDLEGDLAAACDEVLNEDPLGAYSVDDIRYQTSHIVSYYEAEFYISYRRTQEQVRSIRDVTGSSAIRERLRETLRTFSTERVLRVSYLSGGEEYIRSLLRQAYYDSPMTALGMPQAEIAIYPKPDPGRTYPGYARIVEVLFTYPESGDALRRKSQALSERVGEICAELEFLPAEEAAQRLFERIREETVYQAEDPTLPVSGRDTAYAALVEGEASSEGLAMAYLACCRQLEVECTLVEGTKDAAVHFWNIITLPDGESRHVDTSAEEGFALQDGEMVEAGYIWDRTEHPACGEAPEEEEQP